MTAAASTVEQYLDAVRRGNLGVRARLEDELEAERVADENRLTAPGALRSAALWYARRGVAVFPCMPREKRPLARSDAGMWIAPNGLKDATTDADKVAAWWQECPDANIGAPTGRLFDVIDIDGREGLLATYGAGVDFPPEIGHSLTSRTAGHHVFIAPTGAGNRASMYPGVDYRGAGGYVVLPPSIGANGVRYAWTRPLQLEAAA